MRSEPDPDPAPVHALAGRVTDLLGTVDGRPVLVALDGRSGSGKTDLAAALTGLLAEAGLATTTVHLDDLYPGWDGLAAGLGPLCSDVLTPLRSGRPGRYTSWDWYADRPGPVREVPVVPVVVVEGVGASVCGCADLFDLVVWLEVPPAVRRARALARDGATFAPHWERWATQEDDLFTDGPPRVDAVLDGMSGELVWARLDP